MTKRCAVPNCEYELTTRKFVKGMCNLHYQRTVNGTPLDRPHKWRMPGNKNGYKTVAHPKTGYPIGQHRLVMEQQLGRELLPGESVHHRNGVRNDNRPENLILKVKPHGRGIEIEEAIEWAEEILRRYKPDKTCS
jgi:hypothetical protein